MRYFSPTTHKRREIGIGSAYIITLAKARQVAIDIRRQVAEGIDPLELKAKAKKQKQIPNFAEVAKRYITEQQVGWKDPRSSLIWRSSLSRIAYPIIGDKIVFSIDTDDILAL